MQSIPSSMLSSAVPSSFAAVQTPTLQEAPFPSQPTYVPSAPCADHFELPRPFSQSKFLPSMIPAGLLCFTRLAPAPRCFQPWILSDPIPDKDTILHTLQRGHPFVDDVANRMESILGIRATAGGLIRLFERIVPQATWVIYEAHFENNAVSLMFSALERTGKVIFDAGCGMAKDAQGAVEFHSFGAHVDPAYRHWGISAYAELMQEAILKAVSTHPDSRLTLAAGGMHDVNTGQAQPSIGAYLHALRGYLYSDSCGVSSPFFPPPGASQRERMNRQFFWWAQHKAKGFKPRQLVREVYKNPLHPFEFAQSEVGKAFLLSGYAPLWYGVRFVHAPGPDTLPEIRAWRHLSAGVFNRCIQQELKRAQAKAQTRHAELWRQAHHMQISKRIGAYENLARWAKGGQAEVRAFFQTRAQQDSSLQARRAAQDSLCLYEGHKLGPALQEMAGDPHLHPEIRRDMQSRFNSLPDPVDWGFPDPVTEAEAATVAPDEGHRPDVAQGF